MQRFLFILFVFLYLFSSQIISETRGKTIILATTTSTENAGLLSYINPLFEKETGINVKVIALGTGAAVKTAEEGNADVILVHARKLEDEFVASGFGVKRYSVMYNDFVLIGPRDDPAGIKNIKDISKVLKIIFQKKNIFVSRGDNSGTHIKEQYLWNNAGVSLKKIIFYKPKGKWYLSIGQGMGNTINFTNEKHGYTLTDRGTFLAYKKKIDLIILSEGDKRLLNPYGIIAVSPKKHPHTKIDSVNKYIKWITSKSVQKLIAGFKIDGKTLFFPAAN